MVQFPASGLSVSIHSIIGGGKGETYVLPKKKPVNL